jgi:hypothetical protein
MYLSHRDVEQISKRRDTTTYFQQVLARNGSPSHVSMAQKGIGTLTQFRPAAAIWAKSSSVYEELTQIKKEDNERLTMNVS